MSAEKRASHSNYIGHQERDAGRRNVSENNYDVVVIGGGGAGLAAALTACEEGARVLVIEAGDRVGGSTALSGGIYYAADTQVQRAAGIADDVDDMYRYYMTLNQYKLEPEIARTFCRQGPSGIDWLVSLGVEFDPNKLYVAGVDGLKRGHQPEGHGAAIIAALEGHLSGKVEVVTRTRVRELLVEDDRVAGVKVDGEAVKAGAVIIATGGFGANPEKVARFYPEAAAHGEWTWYIGSKHARGDGIDLGQAVGADFAGYNRGLLLATPGFTKELEVYSPSWLVFVNRDGRRFVDETMEYAVLSGVINAQTGGECFAIFDEASRQAAAPDAELLEDIRSGIVMTNWLPEKLEAQAKTGRLLKAATLEELAEKAGIRWPALAQTVARYNADCARGIDTQFEKHSDNMRPIANGPFYAARMRPATIGLTSYGLRIDPEARVRDTADTPIPGLFAAGEVTGGVLGERYCGGGNSVGNAIVFGRIAGRNAARAARPA
jgi:fumarate reductase flavoprotein subunit